MRVELGQRRGSTNRNAKLALIRKADTEASSKFSLGGRTKRRGARPVSLPKLKFMEPETP